VDAAPLRFLALGDSYTVGEGVEPAERWPAQLAAALRADGLRLADPEIVAVTGWTTDELDAGIDAARPTGPFDLVTLLIGVNDQYRGRSPDAYRPALRALLGRALGFAAGRPGRVLLLSIPDWGATPFAADRDRAAIAHAIDAFNAVGREEAARAGVAFVDLTPLSRTQGALVVADRLHPSGEAYAAWAAEVLSAARAAVE
jgi:lysophospholipase L1-like esterase